MSGVTRVGAERCPALIGGGISAPDGRSKPWVSLFKGLFKVLGTQ